jgi:protein-disulfide isomerase
LETADGPTRGAKTSEIAIIEFSDFQCANCKAARVQLDKLASEFPQIKYVFQQFPLPASLHPWAFKAAAFTDCASQISKDAFWNYSSRIFEAQAAISAATSSTALKDLAAASGLNGEKLAACAVKPDTEARIRKSLELGRSLDVNQVPTVFMNGRRVLSIASISYDNLRALVRFEIDHAGR